jgi:hypothetical protein
MKDMKNNNNNKAEANPSSSTSSRIINVYRKMCAKGAILSAAIDLFPITVPFYEKVCQR